MPGYGVAENYICGRRETLRLERTPGNMEKRFFRADSHVAGEKEKDGDGTRKPAEEKAKRILLRGVFSCELQAGRDRERRSDVRGQGVRSGALFSKRAGRSRAIQDRPKAAGLAQAGPEPIQDAWRSTERGRLKVFSWTSCGRKSVKVGEKEGVRFIAARRLLLEGAQNLVPLFCFVAG